MPLIGTETADVYLRVPRHLPNDAGSSAQDGGTHATSQTAAAVTLVFFITGNPGLISYYRPFLDLLVERIEKKKEGRCRDDTPVAVVVAGFSLGGFDVGRNKREDGRDGDGDGDQSAKIRDLMYPSSGGFSLYGGHDGDKIYSLKEQIELCYARVQSLCGVIREEYGLDENKGEKESPRPGPVKVVLMGHSVGTYIGLEMVRLWHERETTPSRQKDLGSGHWTISSCVLLTPTIVDLHSSASGRIAAPLLTSVPVVSGYLPGLAHGLVHAVLIGSGVPPRWFQGLVKKVTGMKEGHGLDATVAFLRSERGVKQALAMAADELREIRADQWGDEVWGAAVDEEEGGNARSKIEDEDDTTMSKRKSPPRMYLWFAKEDHWVADMTRTEVLRNRGRRDTAQGGPTIVIDETEGLVHAWCLEQSEIVAEQVGAWLEEIIE
ncbi:hypothetical protein RBB50_002498 [Rhinocladiella similis]